MPTEPMIEAAADAIRRMFSWQAFQPAHEKLSAGDWSYVAAREALIAALLKAKGAGDAPPPEPSE